MFEQNCVSLPRYDIGRTYDWNYEHAPEPVSVEAPNVAGEWDFCGFPVDSPLGIPAGPLLNGRWVLYYASLGFDVLTYKTVRSVQWGCYEPPNLQPVVADPLDGAEKYVVAAHGMSGSWAVSFGMPSMAPAVWRADVERTRHKLPSGKVLCVSVVGSAQPGTAIDDLADDYARCARWAADAGADCVESNFSCPNVVTCDGQLFQDPVAAAVVAGRVRRALGATPHIVKVGHVPQEAAADALLSALAGVADALSMTNCIAARVATSEGKFLFAGQPRGIGGEAIRQASIDQVRTFNRLIERRNLPLRLIGVGGVANADDVRQYLAAGAHAAQVATAAMVDPAVGLRIRAGMR
jgi:dihydroorotate dehydrogenase (NAD+) catalytic subunit